MEKRNGIHQAAAGGFTRGADAYERARPSYPTPAVELVVAELGISSGSTVVDLGAGTGKFTRLLLPTGAMIIAVEPVAAMRAKLAHHLPAVSVVDASAESTGLSDASADAVVVAQAFHWFRHQEALAEIARILRPGGGLALVWNSRDSSEPWVRRINEVICWNCGQIPTFDAGDERWADRVAASGAFSPVGHRDFTLYQAVDEAALVDRVASTSYIATMPPSERERVLERVREVVAGFPERFVLPYVTSVYWCHRL